jgi:hypothetical protein
MIPSGHTAPREGCQCGIYGSHSYMDLATQYPEHTRFIVGVIAAEGQTIMGPRGLRTERARCVAYWTPDLIILKHIAARNLGADIWTPDIERMLADYHLPIRPEIGPGNYTDNNYKFWNG